jgi:cell wall-associated NlpC family hydrolase
MLAAALALIAGCAAPPRTVPVERPGTTLTPRALDEIANARARELALHALGLIGTPYRYGGSSPQTGFDCSGFVRYVYGQSARIALPRTAQAMGAFGIPVESAALEPGDLVFFDTLGKPFSHVGIYVGDERFIHAPATGGAVELVDMRQRYWRSRYQGARRIAL